MIEEVKLEVIKLLGKDNSGHGYNHIDRVYKLSKRFAEKEDVDIEIVSLIALLHDVDDYKLFGEESAKNLYNAKLIMDKFNISKTKQEKVINAIKKIGYNKRLEGIRPTSKEGMIVSDADMCDAMGVNGFFRAYQYGVSHNQPLFIRDYFPIENISVEEYKSERKNSVINHTFEKMLKLKDLMMTEEGKKEAEKRHKIIVEMLYHFFEEEDAKEWEEYLNKYLNNN